MTIDEVKRTAQQQVSRALKDQSRLDTCFICQAGNLILLSLLVLTMICAVKKKNCYMLFIYFLDKVITFH